MRRDSAVPAGRSPSLSIQTCRHREDPGMGVEVKETSTVPGTGCGARGAGRGREPGDQTSWTLHLGRQHKGEGIPGVPNPGGGCRALCPKSRPMRVSAGTWGSSGCREFAFDPRAHRPAPLGGGRGLSGSSVGGGAPRSEGAGLRSLGCWSVFSLLGELLPVPPVPAQMLHPCPEPPTLRHSEICHHHHPRAPKWLIVPMSIKAFIACFIVILFLYDSLSCWTASSLKTRSAFICFCVSWVTESPAPPAPPSSSDLTCVDVFLAPATCFHHSLSFNPHDDPVPPGRCFVVPI